MLRVTERIVSDTQGEVMTISTKTPVKAELLTREQVQDELGIGYATYFNYIRRYPKQFVTAKVGKRRVMRRETLESFVRFMERAT